MSASALRDSGSDVIESAEPSFLLDHSVLITGEVPRVSGYEPGFPIQLAFLECQWRPDPLVLDDQALIVNVCGKGWVVITGCGHAGVVNINRYATWLTGGLPLHGLIGGRCTSRTGRRGRETLRWRRGSGRLCRR